MKTLNVIIILLLFISGCKTTKIEESIPYILPRNIEWKLFNIMNKNDNRISCFYLIQKDEGKFEIYIIDGDFKTLNGYKYVEKSNRKVLVNDKFYPLVFNSDYIFGTSSNKMKIINLSERDRIDKEEEGYILHRTYVLLHHQSIIFDNKGKIYDE